MSQPIEQMKQNAVSRLNERFGDPLLFSYVVIFALREWPFLYTIACGVGDSQQAIKRASALFSWSHVVIDAALAAVFTFAWPYVHRWVSVYLVSQQVVTKNKEMRAQLGTLVVSRKLPEHPMYVASQEQLRAMHILACQLAKENLRSEGPFEVGRQADERLEVPGFAAVVREGSEIANLVPWTKSYAKEQREAAFLISKLDIEPGMRLILFAKRGASVPWPEQLDAAPAATTAVWNEQSGRMEPSQNQPNEKPYLYRNANRTTAEFRYQGGPD